MPAKIYAISSAATPLPLAGRAKAAFGGRLTMTPKRSFGYGGGQRGLYLGENTVDISKHLVIPKAQHAMTARFDLTRATCIGSSLLIVLTTIKLDNQSRLAADEVDDERADQGPPTKMRTGKRDVVTESSPQKSLSLRRLRAHLFGELLLAFVHARISSRASQFGNPHPKPLPARGRGVERDSRRH